jgi:hypothetical protein
MLVLVGVAMGLVRDTFLSEWPLPENADNAAVGRHLPSVYKLLGEQVQAWTKTMKRKAIERAKFYFFDLGVVRALRGFPVVTEGSADYGPFFEHFVYMELAAWRDYRSPRSALNYWRSTSGLSLPEALQAQT